MKIIYISLALLALGCNNISAQSLTPFVVATSGGFFSNASGMLSETVGELAAVTTLSSANNFLTQGFQQSSDFSTEVSTNEFPDFSISVFPNPSEGFFNLIINSRQNESLELTVYDVLGKKIIYSHQIITSGKNYFNIDLSQRVAGIYLMECMLITPDNSAPKRAIIKLNLSY
jgi:hypothetical protein